MVAVLCWVGALAWARELGFGGLELRLHWRGGWVIELGRALNWGAGGFSPFGIRAGIWWAWVGPHLRRGRASLGCGFGGPGLGLWLRRRTGAWASLERGPGFSGLWTVGGLEAWVSLGRLGHWAGQAEALLFKIRAGLWRAGLWSAGAWASVERGPPFSGLAILKAWAREVGGPEAWTRLRGGWAFLGCVGSGGLMPWAGPIQAVGLGWAGFLWGEGPRIGTWFQASLVWGEGVCISGPRQGGGWIGAGGSVFVVGWGIGLEWGRDLG
ncbi:hypothetical protein FNV43_RR18485 [Rhamnella rubrinervis]|uniref:Uncharacterized protein n=1 Tax=Rhamnella rubrinervis TaxID=2594499 RepID=A0A8K0E5Y5_9ROSA|nr:hypothetical protein FNV43_RR18485 [Rhamnella rubrinervis]